jgi:hypothetical protein
MNKYGQKLNQSIGLSVGGMGSMKSRILTTMDSNKTNRVLERPKRPWSSLLVGCPWGLVSQMWGCTIAPWHPDWLKNAADSTYLASWNIEKQRELIGN